MHWKNFSVLFYRLLYPQSTLSPSPLFYSSFATTGYTDFQSGANYLLLAAKALQSHVRYFSASVEQRSTQVPFFVAFPPLVISRIECLKFLKGEVFMPLCFCFIVLLLYSGIFCIVVLELVASFVFPSLTNILKMLFYERFHIL